MISNYRITAVEKVVDGDTIDVIVDLGFQISMKHRVRLDGIDAPESRTSDVVEKKYGLLAKEKLKEWCADAVEMLLRCPGTKEKFGRVLGELWVLKEVGGSWTNVNTWLCDHGYAVPYHGQNKEDVAKLHAVNREKLLVSRVQ